MQYYVRHWRAVTLGVAMGLIGFSLGWYTHVVNTPRQGTSVPIRETTSGYRFINPLLMTDTTARIDASEYASLKTELQSYINRTIVGHQASDVSVYLRDLNSGKSLGIDEMKKYSPASMLKVATLIAVLREAESSPDILNKPLMITQASVNLDIEQNYVPRDPVKVGLSYTVQDLLSRMIIQSDNNAAAALTIFIGEDKVKKVFFDLQVGMPANASDDYLSPELYSRFFRTLYNSTYMSHPLSDQTLELLTKTDFTKGLVAGVPQGTLVAHKFGERVFTDTSGKPFESELHDCGIVYYSTKPYFLCVMTRGTSFTALEMVISSVSRIVWQGINRLQ